MRQLQSIFREKKPIIGMVHLRPLPGSPMYDPASMDMTKILEIAVDEAKKLQDAGVDGVQVENMWDIPYNRPEDIGYETAAGPCGRDLRSRETCFPYRWGLSAI